MRLIACCTTIPPRIADGSIFNFVNSMLKQTLRPDLVYIIVPHRWVRFPKYNYQEMIDKLKDYHPLVKVVRFMYDSPLIKHIGAYECEHDKETFQFVGDDDQTYHPQLLEKMFESYFDKEAVMQNRYHMVKTGSGGICHGFVGLIYKLKHLSGFFDKSFTIPDKCWIDDQLMSIYFHKKGIRCIPSAVYDYSDIYSELDGWHEKLGGEHALHKLGDRDQMVRELADFYKVQFINIHSHLGKGEVLNLA